jgi:glycosyltransferase involved in cell wall biosynthesis
MKICMLSMKGNFNKNIGQGVQSVIQETYDGVRAQIRSPDRLDRVEVGVGKSLLRRKVSFTLLLPFRDFSGYDIIHTMAPIMFNPRKGGNATTLTAVYEFPIVPEGHILYSEPLTAAQLAGRPRALFEHALFKLIKRQVLGSDYLTSISSLATEEAVKIGFDRKRIFTINIGIDQRFIDQKLPGRKEGGKFKVGYLGNMHRRKNVIFGVRAFRQVPGRDLEFDIWGKQTWEYERLVEEARGDGRIRFKGFAPEGNIVGIYDTFDAFLYPTSYGGFEMELLEAQARGIPVIIDKKAILPKEVRRYCLEAEDPAHAAQIITDLKENGYDQRRRKAALDYARGFTWKRTAEETVKVYRKILNE